MKEDKGLTQAIRKPHAQEFKGDALGLAQRIGVPAAAKELGLQSCQLYGWRSKARGQASQPDVERAQATEITWLKRQLAAQAEELAIVQKVATYFAKSLK